MNILFVCEYNKMRSPTAASIYAADKRFNVKSAGVDQSAEKVVKKEDLEWADYVITMEKEQAHKLQSMFPEQFPQTIVLSLFIPDQYQFMQPELIEELKSHFEYIYQARIIPTEMAKEKDDDEM
ncbi:protein tyrosine phosphatase [Solitalea lacus]|uniref:protein tyrosine phosphatase n=1 Tax=Solitalea lacus TaxID=2911172 RepID=UPI001EDAD72A|nr:protein tyrosine phosphatase [Solitalea lacus]UKJ09110.1 protein tyrosine phosphatase [Solitalea lacus]